MEITLQWFSSSPMDIEYKYYKIMAEFRRIGEKLEHYRIYPERIKIKKWRKEIEAFLQKTHSKDEEAVREFSWENTWENLLELIRFSYKNLVILEQKAEIYYKEVQSHTQVRSVGVESLYPYEGFLFLDRKSRHRLELYLYRLSPVSSQEFPYFSVYWLGEKRYYAFREGEIKDRLVRNFRRRWGNPATFLIETTKDFPSYGAVLPVGLERIYRKISV